jgi:hypothetical protein
MILSHLVWKGTNIKDIMKEINEINEKYKVKIMSLEDLEQFLEFYKYQKSVEFSKFFSINNVFKLGGK